MMNFQFPLRDTQIREDYIRHKDIGGFQFPLWDTTDMNTEINDVIKNFQFPL